MSVSEHSAFTLGPPDRKIRVNSSQHIPRADTAFRKSLSDGGRVHFHKMKKQRKAKAPGECGSLKADLPNNPKQYLEPERISMS